MKKTKGNSATAEFTSETAEMRQHCIGEMHKQTARILSLYEMKESGIGENIVSIMDGYQDDTPLLRKELLSDVFSDETVTQRAGAIIDEKLRAEEALLKELINNWLSINN